MKLFFLLIATFGILPGMVFVGLDSRGVSEVDGSSPWRLARVWNKFL